MKIENNKDIAILLLAGSGTRLFKDINIKKQFYPIKHRELYLYALDSLLNSHLFKRIVLVIDKDDQNRIISNLKTKVEIDDDNEISIIFGGKNRNESVYKGLLSLKDIEGDFAVFIHDAARAIIETETLNILHEEIKHHDALSLYLPMHDSVIKEKDGKISYINRDNLYRVLTPQVFRYSKIMNIYQNGYNKKDTDDFKKAIKAGLDCKLIKGKAINFKVTEKDDLELIEKVISNN